MEIEEMFPAYEKRHNEDVEALKVKLEALVLLFKESIKKIPEEDIFQEIAFDIANSSDDSWMGFYSTGSGIKYVLGEREIEGRIEMEEAISYNHEVEEYLFEMYDLNISFVSFVWSIKNQPKELEFVVELANNEVERMKQFTTDEGYQEEYFMEET